MRLLEPKPYQVIIGSVVAIVAAIIITERVVAFKVNQITHPIRVNHYAMIDDAGQPIQQVELATADGLNLTGWYIPPQNDATIILQHGYSANSAQMLPVAHMLKRHGYGVLMFDFRGHGKSQGEQVTLGLYEVKDTDAAVAFLRQQPEVNSKIGLIGNSMGGATGVLAAAENKQIQAIVIEGVFAELKDEVGIGIQVQTPLPPSPFDAIFVFFAEWQTGYRLSDIAPVKRIGEISPRSILILQGGNDARVLNDSGERLFAAAGEPKEYWHEPSVAHVGFSTVVPEEYEQRVVSFFSKYLLGGQSQ